MGKTKYVSWSEHRELKDELKALKAQMALPQKNHIVEEKIAEVPKELKKWVKAVKMSKLDKGRLMQRMKNPLSGNPKFIPRIDEIMSLAQARSLSTAAQPLK